MSKPEKLFNKNFALLWQGQLVSQIGAQAFSIAALFWTKNQTNSATLVGVLLMLAVLPAIILSPVGGTFADRYSRKKIIVACDLICGFFMTALALTFFFYTGSNDLLFIALLIATLIISAVKSFFSPAANAAIPDIVPPQKVAAANSSVQVMVQLSSLLGTGMGGILFRLLGAPLLFLFNGVAYLISGIFSSFMNIRPVKRSEEIETSSFKQDIVEGFRYIFRNPGLGATLYVFALLNFFVSPLYVILPYYVEDVLKLKPDWYGYVASAFGIGAIIGYVLVGWLKPKGLARRNSILFAFFSSACLIWVLSMINQPVLALLSFTILGVLNGFSSITFITQIQVAIKPEMRGRVMGNFLTLTGAVVPLSLGITGVLIDVLNKNVLLVLMICGLALIALSTSLLFNRNFQRFLAYDPQVVPEEVINTEEEAVPS